MSWLQKILSTKPAIASSKKEIPEGLWIKCAGCNATLYKAELERNLSVCPRCNFHMRITARHRLEIFLDADGQEELAADIIPVDRLKFRDTKKYKDRLATAEKETNETAALIVKRGYLCKMPLVVAVFEFGFIGGSLGAAEGERFVQAVNVALAQRLPLVCFTASGGARMQEGLISLMQMAKTSAALAKLAEQKLPYLTVLTNPTTGGVSASVASLGDIIIAEPNALIGFAGRRVIEQTVRQQLPENFQKSEFLLDHGAIDMIVHRKDLRLRIAGLIAKLTHQNFVNE